MPRLPMVGQYVCEGGQGCLRHSIYGKYSQSQSGTVWQTIVYLPAASTINLLIEVMLQESSLSPSSSAGSKVQQAQAPYQLRRRKITKRGFQLTIMVCGRAGLGKSTFVNTLCDGDIIREGESYEDDVQATKELKLRTHRVDLAESDGAVINLTVVDTPGFGDRIDNRDSCATILQYLEAQFDEVLREEARVRRNLRFQDTRVHVCLYFLPPIGHGLRELDIELMTTLSSRVNIFPVIAKTDTLTSDELHNVKRAVMSDIFHYKIPIFMFNYEDPEDEQSVKESEELRSMVPFAVAGSMQIYNDHDEYVRARSYPWGQFKIENPYHCDFVVLRSVLFGSHLQELRDLTQDVIYEKYRTEQLCKDPSLFARLRQEEEEKEVYGASNSLDTTPAAMAPIGYC